MIAVLRDAGKSGHIRCAMPDRSDCDGGQTLTNPHHNEIGIVLFLGVARAGLKPAPTNLPIRSRPRKREARVVGRAGPATKAATHTRAPSCSDPCRSMRRG